MTESDRSRGRARRGHADRTRPGPRGPGSRRHEDRRPWPTAPTVSRISPAKPAAGTARTGARGSVSTPTPATVWTCGPTGIDLNATWPPELVEKIVSSFSSAGDKVVLLPWSALSSTRSQLGVVGDDGVVRHSPDVDPDPELDDARHVVERLGREVRIGSHDGPQRADLVIASAHPNRFGNGSSDLVTLTAAHLLRSGGILVVLTHCDWTTGELHDPTGQVVASAQNADLLYLQHIVAVHVPVRDGCFQLTDEHLAAGPSGDEAARARHRAQVRGLPEPHLRIHSDVLVFAQPHNRQHTQLDSTDTSGDLR